MCIGVLNATASAQPTNSSSMGPPPGRAFVPRDRRPWARGRGSQVDRLSTEFVGGDQGDAHCIPRYGMGAILRRWSVCEIAAWYAAAAWGVAMASRARRVALQTDHEAACGYARRRYDRPIHPPPRSSCGLGLDPVCGGRRVPFGYG